MLLLANILLTALTFGVYGLFCAGIYIGLVSDGTFGLMLLGLTLSLAIIINAISKRLDTFKTIQLDAVRR